MREWVSNVRKSPPPENVLVEVLCDDYRGEYIMKAKRVDYKKGSTKSQLRRGWRWVNEKNQTLTIKETPNAYRLIEAK